VVGLVGLVGLVRDKTVFAESSLCIDRRPLVIAMTSEGWKIVDCWVGLAVKGELGLEYVVVGR
jgi:hypothetical protein